ncbi:MAG: hypothetical protein QOI35_3217, partial [Cryptosporangiaceae bacterium]|nr:hypothetical protein [Cryptosporangiaceae bacterium]
MYGAGSTAGPGAGTADGDDDGDGDTDGAGAPVSRENNAAAVVPDRTLTRGSTPDVRSLVVT